MKIEELLTRPEGKTLELKQDLSSPKNILKTVTAFANSAGGVILIGIEDGTRAVLGVENPLDEEERLCSLIADSIEPRLAPGVEIVNWKGRTLLVVEVYPSALRPHWLKAQGMEPGVLVRIGSTNRQADGPLRAELRRSALNLSYDEEPMPDINPDTLDVRVNVRVVFRVTGVELQYGRDLAIDQDRAYRHGRRKRLRFQETVSTRKGGQGMSDSGNAAPQCGDHDDKSKEGRSGEWRSRKHRGWYSRGYLPHFDSPHVIQHITYRLADSLPHTALERMQNEVETLALDNEKRKAELRQRIEIYLDAGHGSCVLQASEVAACVVDTWLRFDGERYRLIEWVVMPNHCHVMIEPLEGIPLGKIVLSWKNYTARWINEYKRRSGERLSQENPVGEQQTQVWHREYWDRFIRDERHFEAVKNYIIMNPVNAGLAAKPEDWPSSSAKDWVENDEK